MGTTGEGSTRDVTIEATGTHAITIERDFDHPVDKVFRAMTDPTLIGRWIGPKYLTNVEVTHDTRHGGTWTLVQRAEDGQEYGFRGVLHGEQTPELSQRTFEWLGMPGHVSFETLRLEAIGDGRTRSHGLSVFMSTEDRDGMLEHMPVGVIDGYQRLDELLDAL